MCAIAIGDLSRHLVLRREMTRAKMDLRNLVGEIASERKSDVAKSFRGDVSELTSLETTIANLTSWSRSASLQLTRLAGQQQALSVMNQMADDLWAKLTLSEPETPLPQRKIIAEEAATVLEKMLAGLNTTVGGEALFSGMRSDSPSVSDGQTVLTHLRGLIAGMSSASDIRDAISSWFSQPGGYESNAYQGSTSRPELRIGSSETSSLSITALAPEIREILSGVALAAIAVDYLTPQDYEIGAQLITMSADRILNGSSDRISLMARIGVEEHYAAQALSRNNAELAATTLRRGDLLGVDPYETASALQGAQNRLELIYAVTARLSDLSLVRVLR